MTCKIKQKVMFSNYIIRFVIYFRARGRKKPGTRVQQLPAVTCILVAWNRKTKPGFLSRVYQECFHLMIKYFQLELFLQVTVYPFPETVLRYKIQNIECETNVFDEALQNHSRAYSTWDSNTKPFTSKWNMVGFQLLMSRLPVCQRDKANSTRIWSKIWHFTSADIPFSVDESRSFLYVTSGVHVWRWWSMIKRHQRFPSKFEVSYAIFYIYYKYIFSVTLPWLLIIVFPYTHSDWNAGDTSLSIVTQFQPDWDFCGICVIELIEVYL